jgi:hypothetical protein
MGFAALRFYESINYHVLGFLGVYFLVLVLVLVFVLVVVGM